MAQSCLARPMIPKYFPIHISTTSAGEHLLSQSSTFLHEKLFRQYNRNSFHAIAPENVHDYVA